MFQLKQALYKQLPCALLICATFFLPSLYGQEVGSLDSAVQQFPFQEEPGLTEKRPDGAPSFFEAEAQYDVTGKAKFKDSSLSRQRLRYGEGEASVYYNFGIGCDSGVAVGIGASNTALIWKENPYFHKNHFNNMLVSLSGYSGSLDNWFWQGGLSGAFDSDAWNPKYALYNLTAWGRYSYWDHLGIHVGFIGQTGIKRDKVQPILGIDFKMYNDWQINLVYPVNMSIVYTITDRWSLALAGRIFNSRHRVGKNEPTSRGIFEYRNVGTELALTYICAPYASANIHLGSTLGGDLTISNRANRNALTLKLKQAGYIGWALDLKF